MFLALSSRWKKVVDDNCTTVCRSMTHRIEKKVVVACVILAIITLTLESVTRRKDLEESYACIWQVRTHPNAGRAVCNIHSPSKSVTVFTAYIHNSSIQERNFKLLV